LEAVMSSVGEAKVTKAAEAAGPAISARGLWSPYQIYVLVILLLVNASNYLDRAIVGILQQPIKEDLGLSDWQLGMISGPAFALLYSVAGLPIARLAERGNRITILGAALAFWSGMTALCGLALNYTHLLLARIGVGAGEGACTPTTHSLLSDYFTARQRGMAMAVLTTSINIAQFAAPVIGGFVAYAWGWRAAFLLVGLPGILLAIVLKLTVKEPRRTGAAETPQRSTFLRDVKTLFAQRAYLFLFIASAFLGQGITGTNSFSAAYFMRQFNMTVAQAGVITAVGLGLAGIVGTLMGGYLADRFAGKRGRSYPWICALAAGLSALFFVITFRAETWPVAVAFLLLANMSTDLKNGPNFAAVQNLAAPHMRATAIAVLMVGVIVLGAGLGPPILGAVSDIVATQAFPAALGAYAELCPGGRAAADAPAQLMAACRDASAAGLRGAMLAPCVSYGISAIFFLLSGASIKKPLTD
jgi:predicted MFS family arabinose efflux permease